MLYSRSFIESCRDHQPITGTAIQASLDATESIPLGGLLKRDCLSPHGDVMFEGFIIDSTTREKECPQ